MCFIDFILFLLNRYYCFLMPLTIPILVVSVYVHWLSMKLFKHAWAHFNHVRLATQWKRMFYDNVCVLFIWLVELIFYYIWELDLERNNYNFYVMHFITRYVVNIIFPFYIQHQKCLLVLVNCLDSINLNACWVQICCLSVAIQPLRFWQPTIILKC